MIERISVVIPAYNCEKTIGECLGGIREQSFPATEVIVVDDGSTDKTTEIAKGLATLLSNNRKKGPAGARNCGAHAAGGEILAFIDSDCVPSKDWLQNIVNAFSDDTIGAVGGGYCCGADESFWQRFCCQELRFRRMDRKNYVATLVSNNFACRKLFFREGCGFPEQYPVCEDLFFSYNISLTHKVVWLPDNGVKHHFTNSLKTYLKHQYFFGAESIRFFLHHIGLLNIKSHQGRELYVGITAGFLFSLLALLGIAYWAIGEFSIGSKLLLGALLLSTLHYFLYSGFLSYLSKSRFKNSELIKIYAILLLRDSICGISVFDGLYRAIKKR